MLGVRSGFERVSGVLEPVLAVFGVVLGPGYRFWWCWRLGGDASGPTGGFRRCGMGGGWFMGVPGWVFVRVRV